MIKSVIKRDGRVVLFDEGKIAAAVLKALEAAGEGDAREAARVANKVARHLEVDCGEESPQIEQIQDAVETGLMECGHDEAAKKYILYRANRTRIREANTSLMKTIDEITNVDARISDMKRDNANIDGNTAMGSMLQIGTAGAKAYNAAYLLTPEQAKAHAEGDIHIHDFDFYSLTTTCTQIDILRLFHGGFSTGHGFLREPASIGSYGASPPASAATRRWRPSPSSPTRTTSTAASPSRTSTTAWPRASARALPSSTAKSWPRAWRTC